MKTSFLGRELNLSYNSKIIPMNRHVIAEEYSCNCHKKRMRDELIRKMLLSGLRVNDFQNDVNQENDEEEKEKVESLIPNLEMEAR